MRVISIALLIVAALQWFLANTSLGELSRQDRGGRLYKGR
jgi:hypothetical protein